MFERLMWLVLSYGVVIWGWEERERMEKLQEKVLRWMLGIDRNTPGYMVREELQREMLRGRVGMKTWGYERKLECEEGANKNMLE